MFGKKEILESLRNMQIEMHGLNKKISLINEMMDIQNVGRHDIFSRLDVWDETMESLKERFDELEKFIDSRNYDEIKIKKLIKEAMAEYKEEMMAEKPKKVAKKK